MRVAERKTEQGTVLQVPGDLVAGRAECTLREAVERSLSERPRSLFFDLARVNVMDAAGVGALVSSYVQARDLGCEIALIAPCTQIVSLLALCGLSGYFPVFRSTEDALETREASTLRFPMRSPPESISLAFRTPSCG